MTIFGIDAIYRVYTVSYLLPIPLLWFKKKILENQKNGLPLPNFRRKIGVDEEFGFTNYESKMGDSQL